jgi:hypothetical protein
MNGKANYLYLEYEHQTGIEVNQTKSITIEDTNEAYEELEERLNKEIDEGYNYELLDEKQAQLLYEKIGYAMTHADGISTVERIRILLDRRDKIDKELQLAGKDLFICNGDDHVEALKLLLNI